MSMIIKFPNRSGDEREAEELDFRQLDREQLETHRQSVAGGGWTFWNGEGSSEHRSLACLPSALLFSCACDAALLRALFAVVPVGVVCGVCLSGKATNVGKFRGRQLCFLRADVPLRSDPWLVVQVR